MRGQREDTQPVTPKEKQAIRENGLDSVALKKRVFYVPAISLLPEMHLYEVRPRKDKRGFDLMFDALPFGRLWYGEPDAISNAIGYAKFYSGSHDAIIRVYDEAGNVIVTHEQAGDFKEW
jgi:hypothetical protein